MMFIRQMLVALTLLIISGVATAQDATDRTATGGAQTLEDIMARQRGETVEDGFRRNAIGDPDGAAAITGQLGTLGGASDPELWRQLRYGSADITVSSGGLESTVIMQDGGMAWLAFRQGPLQTYGAYLLGATIALLAVFLLLRGRIMIDGPKTGNTIERFKPLERFAHWMLAGSFIVLGVTGMATLFGRKVIIPIFGHDAFSTIAIGSKWIHNNISWAFMLALIMIFVMWVMHNLPDRTDVKWLLRGGGILGGGHPPAKKFNAGQKLIFWSVILLGGSISISGLSLLFPFEMPMFAATFVKMNSFGIPEALGMMPLPEQLSPHEEMQFAQGWHAIVSFILMAIILAHIYIGSVGMEGAYDAMGTGQVEVQWAREHHSLWVEEVEEKASKSPPDATPAE